MRAQEPYSSEVSQGTVSQGKGILRHWSPGTIQLLVFPRDSVQGEGHAETWEPRNHTTLGESLLGRGVAAPRGGYLWLSWSAQEPQPHSSSSILPFSSLLLDFFGWQLHQATHLIKDIYWKVHKETGWIEGWLLLLLRVETSELNKGQGLYRIS